MLRIKIPESELWDESAQEFRYTKGMDLYLEHSLLSISKWEAKYHKPFFSNGDKTLEETLDYVKFMIVDDQDDVDVRSFLTNDIISQINKYIEDPNTATWFGKKHNTKKKKSGETVTSELVYYWLVALQIPFEVEKWNFNRLLTLIEICNIKNEKPKNIPRKELYSRNTALNELRRRQMNTHG